MCSCQTPYPLLVSPPCRLTACPVALRPSLPVIHCWVYDNPRAAHASPTVPPFGEIDQVSLNPSIFSSEKVRRHSAD